VCTDPEWVSEGRCVVFHSCPASPSPARLDGKLHFLRASDSSHAEGVKIVSLLVPLKCAGQTVEKGSSWRSAQRER
jgi:hypothetical protein